VPGLDPGTHEKRVVGECGLVSDLPKIGHNKTLSNGFNGSEQI